MAHIFENDYAYVTDNGEIWVKETSFFGARKIADLDEMDVLEAIPIYEQSFSQLEEGVQHRLDEWNDSAPVENLDEKKETLADEVRTFAAIGDFESLLSHIYAANPGQGEPETPAETEPEEKVAPVRSEALEYYAALVEKARNLLKEHNVAQAEHDFQNLRFIWKEQGPKCPEEEASDYRSLSTEFEAIHNELKHKQTEARDEQSRRRLEHLGKRKELLTRLENIVSKKKWMAIGEVRSIQAKWEDHKNIPHDQVEALENQFAALNRLFEASRIEFVVRQKAREEDNLAVKGLLLDKLKGLIVKLPEAGDHWEVFDHEFNDLVNQWRKIGRVPKEKENETWDQFRALSHQYEDSKLQLNPKYKEKVEKNEARKRAICEQAEALLLQEDLALAAREINRLHKDWKQIGPTLREKSEELWQRFKTASDAFNERKNQNLDVIRDIENANLVKKEALIVKAEELAKGSEFGNATREMEKLLEDWKQIGPVPRRKSQKVWTQFKTAMDEFFQKKRDHFKEQRNEQRDNLTRKKEIIDAIKALLTAEDAQAAITEVKKLQDDYAKSGFVPIKFKNKIWKAYQEACDAVYERAREARKNTPPPQRTFSSQGPKPQQFSPRRIIESGSGDERFGSEGQRIKKEIDKLKELVLHYSDTMTFIKPNKQGLKLREEIQAKIDEGKSQIALKQEQLKKLNTPAPAPDPVAAEVTPESVEPNKDSEKSASESSESAS